REELATTLANRAVTVRARKSTWTLQRSGPGRTMRLRRSKQTRKPRLSSGSRAFLPSPRSPVCLLVVAGFRAWGHVFNDVGYSNTMAEAAPAAKPEHAGLPSNTQPEPTHIVARCDERRPLRSGVLAARQGQQGTMGGYIQ